VDRTKSRWVAKAFWEFGRSRTTLRALFYFALQRTEPDYPICGGFVGEIRCTRPYHENDGEKLAKWAGKARRLGFIPADALLDEVPGEHVFLPEISPAEISPPEAAEAKIKIGQTGTLRTELWLNRSAFNPLLLPVCRKYGAALVSISEARDRPSAEVIEDLCARSRGHEALILCLSDMSANGFSFCEELRRIINETKPAGQSIEVMHIGVIPEQVLRLNIPTVPIPMVLAKKVSREEQKNYKSYLKPCGLSDKRMAELDALEVYYPGGIAGFVEDALLEALS
jgi:hypothetical protein